MTYNPTSLRVCPNCNKAVDPDPRVFNPDICPYCGFNIPEGAKAKAEGKWAYEWP